MTSEEKRAWIFGPVSASTVKIAAYRYGLPREHAW
jgi:hypothetical protein